jgi:hypothetical protein
MSTPHPTSGSGDRPTAKQLRALRSLAESRGQTFVYPATKAQASSEIRRLLKAMASSRGQWLIEARELSNIRPPRDGAAVRAHEVTGFGSGARWARGGSRGAS